MERRSKKNGKQRHEKSQKNHGNATRQVTYESAWIHNLETEGHWRSYWNQQKLMKEYLHKEDCFLEIGIGSSFCSNYLKQKGYKVTTLDIDKNKKPDIVGNICDMELQSDYDNIIAYEIFEHFSFEFLSSVLNMLHRHCRKYLFVSLPENRRIILIDININVPDVRKFSISPQIPKFIKKRELSKHHHWEVNNLKKHSLEIIIDLFDQCGFSLENKFSVTYSNQIFFVFKSKRSI